MLAPCAVRSTRSRRAERGRRAGAVALMALSGAAFAAPQFRALDVWVNGEPADANALIVEDGGAFYAPASALAAWRLKPTDAPRDIDGTAHHSLQAWQPRLDARAQRLALSAEAHAFTGQVLHLAAAHQPDAALPGDTSPGLALDYTLNMDRDGHSSQGSAFLDLRAFGLTPQSGLRHSGVLRAGPLPPGEARWHRLDTAWRHADPEQMRRINVGDTLSCGGEIAPTLRFAGLQMHTDPSLQPDRVQHPLPSVQGSAQVPSGVDLLVNDRPVGSVNVGSGPFSLQTLPALTGAGEIRIVQRDVQGIEQVRTVPYYTSPRLLRAGLTEACVEAGVLRLDYGLPSDRYSGRFAAAAWRQGLSDTLTGVARVESGSAVRSLRLGMHWVPAQLGVLSVQTAHSDADGVGAGQSVRLGVERVTSRYHLSANLETADEGFRQTDGTRAALRRAALFGGWTVGETSWSAGSVWQRNANGTQTRLFTTTVQRRLGPDWQMGLSALRRAGHWSAAVMLTRQLDRETSLATRAQSGDDPGVSVQAQRHEPDAGGMGWRVQAGSGQNRALGAWSWLGDAGRLEVQAARQASSDAAAVRATATGGLIWLGGAPIAGRALGHGVAAQIEVEGMPGVGVQLNRREVAVTDAQGRAWVFGLQPWQDNVIGISPDALPMDMLVSVPEIRLRPQAESVVKARFPAHRSRSALVAVRLANGEPVAAGSRARRDRDAGEGAPFARGGQVFLSDLDDHNELRIEGTHGVCHLAFEAPAASAPQPRIGPFTCQAEAP
jgi:outer membrane usher protein